MARTLSESELIKRIINDDREAFAILYKRYLSPLYRYLYLMCKSRDISEEIVQDVFIKTWERRAHLDSMICFKAYTYLSAKNLLRDRIKADRIKERVLIIMQPHGDAHAEPADAIINYKEYSRILENAIDLLPAKRKQIIQMRIKDEFTLDEIADKLSISKSVVKKQLYMGRNFIKKHLHNQGEIAAIVLFLHNCLHIHLG